MRTFIHIVVCVLLTAQACFAQWYQQNSGTTKMLFSVYFITENIGWTCGDEGEIRKTTDGGNNWILQNSNTIFPLHSIYFISETTGWAAGGYHSPLHGLILNTTDGGNNWYTQTSTIPFQLFSIYFISNTTGWVAGNANNIFKTTDGGVNWVAQASEIADLQGIFFINENIGWTVGGSRYNNYSKILKTTNGGDNWVAKTAATNNYLRSVHFISETTGWVVGNSGVIFRSTDGGENWVAQTSGISNDLSAVHFANENYGWTLGANGRILKTLNGGTDWSLQTSGTTFWLYGVSFTDTSYGWIAGSDGVILHTTNGGLPVEFKSFAVISNGMEIILNWSTATETNNQGFEVERQVGSLPDGEAGRQSTVGKSVWEKIGYVPGYGTTTEPKSYSYTDSKVSTGKYTYRLKQLDFDGSYEYSQEVEAEVTAPIEFTLEQNYPNPFNPSTVISYQLPVNGDVMLKVFDVLGNEIATLVDEYKPAGNYEVEFNPSSGIRNLVSGIYFCRLQTENYSKTIKMLYLK